MPSGSEHLLLPASNKARPGSSPCVSLPHTMHKYWHYELMKIIFDYTSTEPHVVALTLSAELNMEPILATGCLISCNNALTWESFAAL